jgi:hypothetical protein
MESGLYDEEMGIFGDILGVIGEATGVTKAGKGLLQELGILDKPKKKKAAPVAPAAAAPTIIGMPQAPAAPGLSAHEVQYVVKDLLRTIPSPIRQKLREVVNEMKGSDASEENLVSNIEQRVGSNVMPQLNKAIHALKLAQTQTEATSEHRALVNEQDRWRDNKASQQQLMNRIVRMESQLAKALKKKKR